MVYTILIPLSGAIDMITFLGWQTACLMSKQPMPYIVSWKKWEKNKNVTTI